MANLQRTLVTHWTLVLLPAVAALGCSPLVEIAKGDAGVGGSATGGVAATGGTPATGGVNATGGTLATGGLNATGGTPATGGVNATGGSDATGGLNATGGARPVLGPISTISVSGFHSCALADGSAYCWGSNGAGQLGNGSTIDSPVAVQVQGLTSGVTAIAAGNDSNTCALVNGGAQCWGNNSFGQLGNNYFNSSLVPVQVRGLTAGVTAIAAADLFTCALVSGGVQCWGSNFNDGLGDGSTGVTIMDDTPYPVQVQGLTSGATAITTGCAVVNGGAQCWGDNGGGQLGNGTTINSPVPVQVQGLTSGVTAIATAGAHTCAIVNGGVQCWGSNTNGQLGNGTATPSDPYGISTPVTVSGLSNVDAIATGTLHTCALVNGGVQCWGLNQYGQLGNKSWSDSSVPVQVPSLTSGVTAIGAGERHTCAVVNGGVQCWGGNYGGSTTESLVPVPIQFP